MTDYEMIMIFLGVLGIMISFGVLLLALLTYVINRHNKRK